MKASFHFGAALLALLALTILPLAASAQATTGATPTGTTPKPSNTVKVDPPGQGSQNGITATNGNYQNDWPALAGSTGSIRLRKINGNLTHSNVTTDNGTRCDIDGVQQGDTVTMGVNNQGTIRGDGGEVTLAGGSTVSITNTGLSGVNMTVNIPGGSFQIPPGVTIPVTTN